MGEYAAAAWAAEMGVSYETAYDMLYGESPRNPRRCPICQHKCRGPDGVRRHVEFVHKKTGDFRNQKHAELFRAWEAAQ